MKGDIVMSEKMMINVKKVKKDAKLPFQGSTGAAGWDLCACIAETILIPPHCTVKIGTGLAFEIPDGYFAALFARSGIATKQGLRPANCTGVCDSDYRGEYIVAIHNDSDEQQFVHPDERIAQMIVMPYLPVTFNEVEELDETERGAGGFGSTGK